MTDDGDTPLDSLDWVEEVSEDDSPEDKAAGMEITALLLKHGGKTGKELRGR